MLGHVSNPLNAQTNREINQELPGTDYATVVVEQMRCRYLDPMPQVPFGGHHLPQLPKFLVRAQSYATGNPLMSLTYENLHLGLMSTNAS